MLKKKIDPRKIGKVGSSRVQARLVKLDFRLLIKLWLLVRVRSWQQLDSACLHPKKKKTLIVKI